MGGRGGSGRSIAAPAVPAAAPASAEAQIRDAYDQLPHGPAGYVGLADLRDQLGSLPKAQVDQALRELSRQPGVHVTPVANRKSLTPRDRAAMILIGEDENHMISIDRNR